MIYLLSLVHHALGGGVRARDVNGSKIWVIVIVSIDSVRVCDLKHIQRRRIDSKIDRQSVVRPPARRIVTVLGGRQTFLLIKGSRIQKD